MCSAHPSKGDLLSFEGLTAEQEEYHEQCARAHVGAILNRDKTKHRYFSKELMHWADPEFIPSPPASPAWQRQPRRPRKAQPPSRPPESEEDPESEEEEPQNESRDLADIAALWADSEDEM